MVRHIRDSIGVGCSIRVREGISGGALKELAQLPERLGVCVGGKGLVKAARGRIPHPIAAAARRGAKAIARALRGQLTNRIAGHRIALLQEAVARLRRLDFAACVAVANAAAAERKARSRAAVARRNLAVGKAFLSIAKRASKACGIRLRVEGSHGKAIPKRACGGGRKTESIVAGNLDIAVGFSAITGAFLRRADIAPADAPAVDDNKARGSRIGCYIGMDGGAVGDRACVFVDKTGRVGIGFNRACFDLCVFNGAAVLSNRERARGAAGERELAALDCAAG